MDQHCRTLRFRSAPACPPATFLARRLRTSPIHQLKNSPVFSSATGLKTALLVSRSAPETPQTEKIGVAVVDDEPEIRLLLQDMLEGSGEFRCVGSYATAAECVAGVSLATPQVVLMDIRMPGMSGVECTRELKRMVPGVKVVMVSAMSDPQTVEESLRAGGDGYVTKPFSATQCLTAIRCALRRTGIRLTVRVEALADRTPLTRRETEVMNELARGLLYKEVAERLGISLSRVHKIQHRIYFKLGVMNRTEAVLKWTSRGQ